MQTMKEPKKMILCTANWTYLIVTTVVVVFAYLPGGSPAHFLLGLTLLLGRLLILLGVAWFFAWLSFQMFSRSNRTANITFAFIVSFFLVEAAYMLLHHEGV